MRRSLALVVSVALAACRQEPEAAAPVAAPSASASTFSPAAPPAEAAKADTPEVTLTADGIILVGAVEGRGTATTLTFGQEQPMVLDVMEVDFGLPKLSRFEECGAGPMEFAAWGPLTFTFLGGKFAGWRAERGAPVVTVDGVQLGNTLTEIKHERSAQRVPGTTLEGEFEYASGDGGTIGGFLEGSGDAAKVISFHAGVNCFFR